MSDTVRTAAAMQEAISILSKGAWRRTLDIHHEGCGGRCASCGQRHPCSLRWMASAAGEVVAGRAAREAQHAARLAAALTPPGDTRNRDGSVTEQTGGAA